MPRTSNKSKMVEVVDLCPHIRVAVTHLHMVATARCRCADKQNRQGAIVYPARLKIYHGRM